MTSIKLESTDSDNITMATTVVMDFENERSVEQGFIQILNFLERLGLELPAEVTQLMAVQPRKKILRG